MAETEPQKIIIAKASTPISEMRRLAGDEKKAQPSSNEQGVDRLVGEFRRYADLQQQINQSFHNQAVSFENFVSLSQKQVVELVASTRLLTPEEERSRWTDSEYDQEFYTRFQPGQEPHFYAKLETKDRELYDARWQLARAAFVKTVTSNFPDKYKENQDLTLLGKEQMERLYRIPGVRKMLEGYVKAIVEGDALRIVDAGGEQRTLSFWDIKSAADFEKFRVALRKAKLKPLDLDKLAEKEADAVAWNLTWVSNLVESVDSRYSFTGESHGKLPGVICAGECKYALHPQERFEGKCVSGHFWGVFGTWGVNQLNRIKGLYGNKDEFKFVPAPRGRYWWSRITNEPSSKGGRVVIVYAPECYPLAPARSFFEETTFRPNGNEVSLLDTLLAREEIPWNNDTLAEDMWGIYATSKFNKAVQLLAFFEGDEKLALEEQKEQSWTFPILELFTRLKIKNQLDDFSTTKRDRSGKIIRPALTYQTFHNFKVWTIMAGRMGVRKYEQGDVTSPLRFVDKAVFQYRLAHPKLGSFLDRGEKIEIK